MKDRYYCATCGSKRYSENMALVYFSLIHKEAWICLYHLSNASFYDIIYVKKAINFTTESLLQQTIE